MQAGTSPCQLPAESRGKSVPNRTQLLGVGQGVHARHGERKGKKHSLLCTLMTLPGGGGASSSRTLCGLDLAQNPPHCT